MTDVRNSAKLARINAGQLGHYAIGLGFEFTLFGRNGLQPFVGFKSYNLKVGSVYFGAGLFHLSENFLATAQLYYDNLLENTILAVSFSI